MLHIMKDPYSPLPEMYSPPVHALVGMMLEKNPDLRASIDDILCVPAVADTVL